MIVTLKSWSCENHSHLVSRNIKEMKPWKAQDTSNNYSGMIMVALQTSHAGRKVETIRLIKEIKGLHTALDRANCTSKIHQLGVVESKRQRGTIRHTYNILNSISSNTPFDTPTLEPSDTPYDIPCWIIQYSVQKPRPTIWYSKQYSKNCLISHMTFRILCHPILQELTRVQNKLTSWPTTPLSTKIR